MGDVVMVAKQSSDLAEAEETYHKIFAALLRALWDTDDSEQRKYLYDVMRQRREDYERFVAGGGDHE